MFNSVVNVLFFGLFLRYMDFSYVGLGLTQARVRSFSYVFGPFPTVSGTFLTNCGGIRSFRRNSKVSRDFSKIPKGHSRGSGPLLGHEISGRKSDTQMRGARIKTEKQQKSMFFRFCKKRHIFFASGLAPDGMCPIESSGDFQGA